MVNSFLPKVLCDSVSCRDSWQDEESHGQSQQEAVSLWTAVWEGSKRSQTMTDSLGKKQRLADYVNPFCTQNGQNSMEF